MLQKALLGEDVPSAEFIREGGKGQGSRSGCEYKQEEGIAIVLLRAAFRLYLHEDRIDRTMYRQQVLKEIIQPRPFCGANVMHDFQGFRVLELTSRTATDFPNPNR